MALAVAGAGERGGSPERVCRVAEGGTGRGIPRRSRAARSGAGLAPALQDFSAAAPTWWPWPVRGRHRRGHRTRDAARGRAGQAQDVRGPRQARAHGGRRRSPCWSPSSSSSCR
ncbi:hypothetical protein QJS66_23000 [Kocuria rhizophila]|nr:hypothetical protein QJS66_23000 [Kocuria rhizophila]